MMRTLVLGISIALTVAAPARAGPLEATGRLARLHLGPTDRVLVRHNGAEHEGLRFQYLYPGDEVAVKGGADAWVEVQTLSQPDGFRLAAGARSLRVLGHAQRHRSYPDAALSVIRALMQRAYGPLVIYDTMARGPDSVIPPPAYSSLLPGGIQYAAAGSTRLAFVWKYSRAALVVRNASAADGQQQTQVSDGFLAIRIAPLKTAVEVSSSPPGVAWIVEAGVPPRPTWLETPELSLSSDDRILRAAWILKEGPPSWRAFAIGEIEQFSHESFAAARILRAVRADEFLDLNASP